jgi:O-antigen/teichoic acid export membrane protein
VPESLTSTEAPASEDHAKALKNELPAAVRTSTQLGLSLLATWTVALVVRFLLPRYLGPTLFGELNFAEAFATGCMLLTTLGIDLYTMREVAVRPAHASDYFAGVHVVRLIVLFVLLPLMIGVLSARGARLELQLTVLAWAVTQFLVQINSTLGTLLQAVAHARPLAVANVVGKVAWGLGLLALVLMSHSVAPLWAYVVPALGAELLKLVLTFPAARSAVTLRMHVSYAHTCTVLLACLPFLVTTLAYNLGAPLNYWVLDLFKTDARELGYYGATLSLVSLAMLFSPLMNWVLLPILSRAGARSKDEVNVIMAYALEAFLLAVIPVVLLAWLGAEQWVQLAFGQAYAPSATALRVMVLMIVFTYTGMLIACGLVVQGHSWSLSSLSLLSVLLAPGLGSALVPSFGRWLGIGGEAAGAACAVTMAEVITAALAVGRMGRAVTPPRLWRALGKALLACFLVAVLDRWLGGPAYVRLAVDMIAFGALAWLLRVVNVAELRALVSQIRRRG